MSAKKVIEVQTKIDKLMAEHADLARAEAEEDEDGKPVMSAADIASSEKVRAGLVKKMDALTEDLQKASK